MLLQYFRTIPHNRTAGVLPAQPLHDASGKLFLTDTHRRAKRSHTLLGKTMCAVAFRALTRISKNYIMPLPAKRDRTGRCG